MDSIVCPHCSSPTAPGRFCEFCGRRLPDYAAASAADVPTSAAVPPKTPAPAPLPAVAPHPGADGVHVPPSAIPELPALGALPALPPLPALSVPATQAARPGSLAVECSLPERLVEGLSAVLLFRLRSEGRDMESVELSLAADGREIAGPARHGGVLGLQGAEIPLNVRPSESGCLAVELHVECRRSGSSEPERWTAPLTLLVEPSSSGSAPLTINVHNTGDLAEISLGQLAGGLRPGDRLGVLANPRVFRPVDGLRLAASPSRLTLALPDGGRIHLVARRPAWFGRQGERPDKGRFRDNAVVLRASAADGRTPDPGATRCLSRSHFLVEPTPSGAVVRDGAPGRDPDGNILPGGPETPSAGGLVVDGLRLSPCGATILSPGVEHTLVLSPEAREGGALTLSITVFADGSGRASGALLRRTDAVPGLVLLVWGDVDLGVAAPSLRGTVVLWDGSRFLAFPPDGTERPLAPGLSFGPVRVETFHQTFL